MRNKDYYALLGDPQERDYQIWERKQMELERELDEMVLDAQAVFFDVDGTVLDWRKEEAA